MSIFTVVIIIWVIYHLGVSLIKKGRQQAPGRPQGSLREQIQQAMADNTRQMEKWTVPGELLKSAMPKGSMDGYVQTEGTQGNEGTQGVEGTQGIEGTSTYEGTNREEFYRGTEGNLDQRIPRGIQVVSGIGFSMSKSEIVQGVVWAEILGKPRALHPFRGPRSLR